MSWQQTYNPLNNVFLSTLAAILPLLVLLGCIGIFRLKAHISALLGISLSLIISILVFGMPVGASTASALYGAVYGLFPIGWIILNVIFLYRLADGKGLFQILQGSLTALTQDRRLQLILVAFCLGAFFEGAAGFGTPVAVCASILIGLGFPPLAASAFSLIAITAPVPFAALGAPLIALQSVTGLELADLSAMVGWQMVLFNLILPFWLIIALAGWRRMWEVFPALLITGSTYAVCQILLSNLHGPWLVNIVSALVTLAVLALFLLRWKPKSIWRFPHETPLEAEAAPKDKTTYTRRQIFQAWMPWLILSLIVFIWGLPPVKAALDSLWVLDIPVPGLDQVVERIPPVTTAVQAQSAIFHFNPLSAAGTAILIAAIISGLLLGYSARGMLRTFFSAFWQVRFALLTITAMVGMGFVIRYSGMDGTLGLAFSYTGALYPFFGTLLGWLGVAITGSDTSSNVLFGSLQRVTAERLGIDPVLMASANSSGGVMGKMIDPQSIVVASSATRWYGHEADILRFVFLHSLGLAALVGVLVMLMAYVYPFTQIALLAGK